MNSVEMIAFMNNEMTSLGDKNHLIQVLERILCKEVSLNFRP